MSCSTNGLVSHACIAFTCTYLVGYFVQELLTLRQKLGPHLLLESSVLIILVVCCVALCLYSTCVLCAQCFQYLMISSSVFYSVYFVLM